MRNLLLRRIVQEFNQLFLFNFFSLSCFIASVKNLPEEECCNGVPNRLSERHENVTYRCCGIEYTSTDRCCNGKEIPLESACCGGKGRRSYLVSRKTCLFPFFLPRRSLFELEFRTFAIYSYSNVCCHNIVQDRCDKSLVPVIDIIGVVHLRSVVSYVYSGFAHQARSQNTNTHTFGNTFLCFMHVLCK